MRLQINPKVRAQGKGNYQSAIPPDFAYYVEKGRSLTKSKQSIPWVLTGILSYTIAMALSKKLDKEVPTFVLLFMRSTFGLLLIVPFFIKEGTRTLKTSRWATHVLRVTFMFASMYCTYSAYRSLPLPIVASIGFIEPLIVTVLSYVILGDKVSFLKWASIIFGYAGVLLIMRPGHNQVTVMIGVALLANLFSSLSIICTKKLSDSESMFALMFYANVTTFIISIILAAFSWKTPALKDAFILGLIGLFGNLYQFCYLKALRLASPSFLAPFQYTRLAMALLIGIAFFSEFPDTWSLLGAGIIISSTYAHSRSTTTS